MNEFQAALLDLGITEEELNGTLALQVSNYGIAFNQPGDLLEVAEVRPSIIHGSGTFATASQPRNRIFMPVRLGKQVTLAGMYVNHSHEPNCQMVHYRNGDLYLQSLEWICVGDELTQDYRVAVTGAELR